MITIHYRLASAFFLLQLVACNQPSADGTTDDGTSGTDTTGGPPFVPIPDLDSRPVCDPFMQDCPDGEKCQLSGMASCSESNEASALVQFVKSENFGTPNIPPEQL